MRREIKKGRKIIHSKLEQNAFYSLALHRLWLFKTSEQFLFILTPTTLGTSFIVCQDKEKHLWSAVSRSQLKLKAIEWKKKSICDWVITKYGRKKSFFAENNIGKKMIGSTTSNINAVIMRKQNAHFDIQKKMFLRQLVSHQSFKKRFVKIPKSYYYYYYCDQNSRYIVRLYSFAKSFKGMRSRFIS